MATDVLRPSSDVSNAGIAFSAGTTTWSLIDDDPDSASNADYIYETTTLGEDVAWVNLAPVTGFTNFAAMTAATVRVRYETTGWTNDTWRWSVQVFKADQTTALTGVGAVELGTNVTPTNVDAATINADGQAASAAEWAAARLRIGVGVTNRNMGADSGAQVRIHAVEVNVTYDNLPAKTDVPFRRSSASKARTVTAVLQGDQWGKYLVPQVPWINPVRRGYAFSLSSTSRGPAISPDGRFVAATASAFSPYIRVFDTRGHAELTIADLAGQAAHPPAWSPDGRFLAAAHGVTPFVTIYERSGSTFTKLADPSTLPPSTGTGVGWSPDGRFLVVSHLSTPFITIYERSGTSFTKLTNPGTLPTGEPTPAAWSPDGRFFAVGLTGSPYYVLYERAGTTFTSIAVSTPPTVRVHSIDWSPDGRFLVMGLNGSPFLHIYERSGTTFTKLTEPSNLPSTTVFSVKFSPDGSLLALGSGTSPYTYLYHVSQREFIRAADVPVVSTSNYELTWSPDGRFLYRDDYILETSGQIARDGLLWMPNPGER